MNSLVQSGVVSVIAYVIFTGSSGMCRPAWSSSGLCFDSDLDSGLVLLSLWIKWPM